MKKKLYIIGTGPGDPLLLTGEAQELIRRCGYVFTTHRLAEQFRAINPSIETCELLMIEQKVLDCEAEEVAVLVSGDTGFFSMAGSLRSKLGDRLEIETVNGLSSLQYLCARVGVSYEKMQIVSVHGRERNFLGHVAYNERVFFLTGGRNRAQNVCTQLAQAGFDTVKVTAGERLSLPDERIVTGTARELSQLEFDDLTVLLLHNSNPVDCHVPVRDDAFVRGDVPMTKEEIRWLTVARLGILPDDIIYDIGAGTGSVSIEMARRACRGMVYAVEREEEGVRLIEENRIRHGAYNVWVVSGEAPGCMDGLPAPDRAFVGGSGGKLWPILVQLLAINPAICVTVNAVTIETTAEAVSAMTELGMNPEIINVNVARSRPAGRLHLMAAQNPVSIITGGRKTAE